jgi:lipopolysaccharide/colanic/teichoic acid biosynthesis glycosyltransferase
VPVTVRCFACKRIGKNGKEIGVYKFRTMHPYAEYLQDYVLKLNGYAETGKPKDDFRLTPWGRFLRRYWLDELPQLINLIKGEMKLVGTRPVSARYLQDIPEDLRALRLKFKPGCIPPYVALNRKGDVNSVLQAEREYLEEKARRPYTTDTRYFFKAIFNIYISDAREVLDFDKLNHRSL